MLKTIAGHTSARGICRYLTRKNRALASDYINIDAPDPAHPEAAFDWARVMDSTRRAFGNDLPWRGRRVRTYKHYVVSPDPKDGIALDPLRELATAWAHEHFSEYEVAIIYHDDNERGIPHAHVVVNNTNIETGRRLQDPDPKALASSLQDIAERQGLSALRPPEPTGVAARAQRRHPRRAPETYRSEYVRRAEKELAERGEYSWTADIRARVRIARTVARSEAEFRSVLSSMGVTVTDNSPKAQRRDWIYALADHPARRVSGERMGLAYGRERLEPLLRSGGIRRLEDAGERAIAAIAKRAVEVGALDELERLSDAVALIESMHARCLEDLDALSREGDGDASRTAAYVREMGLLPQERPATKAHRHQTSRAVTVGNRGSATQQRSDAPQPMRQSEQQKRRTESER